MTEYKWKCPRCTMSFEESSSLGKGAGKCLEPNCGLSHMPGHREGSKDFPPATTAEQARNARLMGLQ